MIKQILFLTTLFTVFSNIVSAQTYSYDSSICWEIEKTDTTALSYIVGSIHQLDTSKIKFPVETFCRLIDKCQSVCFEIIIETKNSTTSNPATNIFLANNLQNITNSLNDNHYNRLIQIIDSAKSDLKQLKPLISYVKPTVITLMIEIEKQFSNSAFIKIANFAPDGYFQNYAREKGYEINHLETQQLQAEWIMPDIPFDEAIDELKESIDQYSEKDSVDLFLSYRNQNLGMLEKEVYSDSIMVSRNKNMVDGIDRLISKKPTFIMIGAAHLPFENGVLNLLEKKGYRIQPVAIDMVKGR